MGVRISWLILARNSDLARFAASAASARLLQPQKHFLFLRDIDHGAAEKFGLPRLPVARGTGSASSEPIHPEYDAEFSIE